MTPKSASSKPTQRIDRQLQPDPAYFSIILIIPVPGGYANALIHQFKTHYPMGLTPLTPLGQTVSHAEETLDIDRAYLEIPALQNLTRRSFMQSREIYSVIPFGRLRQRSSGEGRRESIA